MIDFATLKDVLKHLVEISPTTGRPRFSELHNDVLFHIERLGGTEKAATVLGTSQEEVEQWIDEHYVPQPFANRIHDLTRATVCLIQEPITVVIDDTFIWPPVRDPEIQKRLNLPPLAEDGVTILGRA